MEFNVSQVSKATRSIVTAIWGVSSGHKYGGWTHQQKSFCLFFFATFYGLYFVCSTNIAYAGDREDEKPNYQSRRHKGCFSSKRRIQSVANLTRAKKCITQGNKNHPEEEQDFEPPRKIETRSQVCCLCDKYLLLRR